MLFKVLRLAEFVLSVFYSQISWAQDPGVADKFEVTYGINRSKQSLLTAPWCNGA